MKKKTPSLLVCFLFSSLAASAFSQPYGLPKTGQTAIFRGPGENDLGDDGSVRIGYPASGMRFTDNGNGTVTDLGAGLIWQKADSASQTFGGFSGKMNWDSAFQYLTAMNNADYGGRSDWRLPNVKELLSIVNMGTWGPSSYYIFSTMKMDPYWSGTSFNAGQSYAIFFTEGLIQWLVHGDSTALAYVKAVASYYNASGVQGFPKTGQTVVFHQKDDGDFQAGYPKSGASFTEYSDFVKQAATGLFWQKCDSLNQSFGGLSGSLTWEEAFDYVSEMNRVKYAGYEDWRLPNYFELASLVKYEDHWGYPLIDPAFYGNSQREFYWSSTSRFGPTPDALAVGFDAGWGVQKPKAEQFYVRAVRGGPYIPPAPSPAFPTPTPCQGVPKTGQTAPQHYDDPPWDLGDDGVTQVGYPLGATRFQDNGNGTVTDLATGLMWQQAESSSHAFEGLSGIMTWEKTFNYVAAMNRAEFGGYRDWRLPNIKEISSLVNFGTWSPSISSLFTGTEDDAGYYGSSTFADTINGRHIFQFVFSEGFMQWTYEDEVPAPTGYVRAVRSLIPENGNCGFPRSGQNVIFHYPSGEDLGDDGAVQAGYPAAASRFMDKGDGTVLDKATNLIWQKADSSYQQVGSYSGRLDWETAFAYIREMNIRHTNGYSRWRMPNIQELISLIDFGQFSPALDPIFKSCNQSAPHWSGTSRAIIPDYHWAVNFTLGQANFSAGTETYYVKGVLGGPGQDPGPTITAPTPTPYGNHTPLPSPSRTPSQATPTPPAYVQLYYGLPKTGQVTIYHNASGYDLGDDAQTQIGYPEQPPRWEDLGNGILIDWATGLMWQQSESHGQPLDELSGVMTWEQSFQYVATLNRIRFGGFCDWRLPNCRELHSTRDLEHDPCIPSVFVDTTYDEYWTSTHASSFSQQTEVFTIGYYPGYLLPRNITVWRAAVRACRSFYPGSGPLGFPRTGQTMIFHPPGSFDLGDDGATQSGFPEIGPRFTDNQDGTVTDRATGLMWQKGCLNSGKNWEDAFAYVASLNSQHLGGYSDWRLPNQMEMASIVDYGRSDPAIDESFFDDTLSSNYWSSNTVDRDETTAWAVSFLNGYADHYTKSSNLFSVRAVRGDIQAGPRPTPTPELNGVTLASGDYNGDGTGDIGIFRPRSALWVIKNITRCYYGSSTDIPVSGDYDNDGTSEIAIFRPSGGMWGVHNLSRFYFGIAGDIPLPGNYTKVGPVQAAIFRPGSGRWVVRNLTVAYFGNCQDRPQPGDYNGDGGREPAIYRPEPGLWAVMFLTRFYFGSSSDIPLGADFNGDGTDEAATFRRNASLWAVRGVSRFYFGSATDRPVPADFNGDRRVEAGVFRDNGLWAIRLLTRTYLGAAGDIPISR